MPLLGAGEAKDNAPLFFQNNEFRNTNVLKSSCTKELFTQFMFFVLIFKFNALDIILVKIMYLFHSFMFILIDKFWNTYSQFDSYHSWKISIVIKVLFKSCLKTLFDITFFEMKIFRIILWYFMEFDEIYGGQDFGSGVPIVYCKSRDFFFKRELKLRIFCQNPT